ncbi:protease Lon-related BREX system protein BrxL, partial [Spirulina sp. 06S082]|uniref:protease Lon-related BREX system protein BrxL n=1 Tax=Spirulina sp. 06S082 TaxID=3110248 RepID=UPI002B1F6ED8
IDRVTVKLNEKEDFYQGELGNLGIKEVVIDPEMATDNPKLLGGGIWCILKLEYEAGTKPSPFLVTSLKPIQMPSIDTSELFAGRPQFTREEWIDLLLRSAGLEPTTFTEEVKWHLLARMIPLCENNYNCCELGPRSTGKSHLYKEVSPNSLLVSGGQTTVPNLFYNMASRRVGLVGLFDVVAFDEVAGIHFKDKDGIQIMKDYMASGSFARGKAEINASASMVFVGNINQSVETLLKTSHLLSPFPAEMIDTAFFDRFHAYIPGWEIPKLSPENFTKQYGFIVDYLAEWLREMRKRSFADAIDGYFRLGNNLKQRDVQAVRKTVSGLLKLLFPDGSQRKEDVETALIYALRVRRRVKEQLKKIGGMEFYDVHFSYIDLETLEEHFVSVPEIGGANLISPDLLPAGHLHFVTQGDNGTIGTYKLELQTVQGTGKLVRTGGASASKIKDALNIAFNFFKANAHRVSSTINSTNTDFLAQILDLQGTGIPEEGGLSLFIALCSAALKRSVQAQLAIFGEMTLGGTITPVRNLADSLQVAFDAGAQRILLPMSSAADLSSVPPELLAKFQTSFYTDPVDAVFKSMIA